MYSCFLLFFHIQSTFAVADEDRIIVYSSAEEYRNKYYAERLKERFPQYDIVIEYMPMGNHAARLKSDTSPSKGAYPPCNSKAIPMAIPSLCLFPFPPR